MFRDDLCTVLRQWRDRGYLCCAEITSVTPWVLTFLGTPMVHDCGPLGVLLVPGSPDEYSWLLYLSPLVSWLGRVDPCLL